MKINIYTHTYTRTDTCTNLYPFAYWVYAGAVFLSKNESAPRSIHKAMLSGLQSLIKFEIRTLTISRSLLYKRTISMVHLCSGVCRWMHTLYIKILLVYLFYISKFKKLFAYPNSWTYTCKFDPLNTLLKWCEGFVARIILPFKRSFCGGPPMRTAWTPDISESIVITASTPNKRVTPFTVMVHLANILNCV